MALDLQPGIRPPELYFIAGWHGTDNLVGTAELGKILDRPCGPQLDGRDEHYTVSLGPDGDSEADLRGGRARWGESLAEIR